LPAEVRVRIYRFLLVLDKPFGNNLINEFGVWDRQEKGHEYGANASAQILSTCKTVLNEGLPLLFTENSFLIHQARHLAVLKRLFPSRRDKVFM
jgi:hypothetical protein